MQEISQIYNFYNIDVKKPLYHYKNIRIYHGDSVEQQQLTIQVINNKDGNPDLTNSFLQQYEKLKTISSGDFIEICHEPAMTNDGFLVVGWKTPKGILFTNYIAKQLSIKEMLDCMRQLSVSVQSLFCANIYTSLPHPGNITYTEQKKFIIPSYGLITHFSHSKKYFPFPDEFLRHNLLYSLAVLGYQLLTKNIVFPHDTKLQCFKTQFWDYKKPAYTWEKNVYSDLIDLMENCLNSNHVDINFDMVTKKIDDLIKICDKNREIHRQKTQRMIKGNQKVFCDHILNEELGKGASAIVYKAYHIKMKRDVALKMMHSIPKNEKNILRFKREAQAIANLEHDNIVKLYQVGEKDGVPFFSMEYVDGLPLDQYIFENKLSFEEIAKIFLEILYTLQYAHQNSIIHRDLKPSNVLVNKNGKPYIMDFGVAKIGNASYQITATGELIGTIFYMSPEQVRGKNKKIDIRTDIYSTGVMLYQAVTGKLPFDDKSSIKLMHRICTATPVLPSKEKEGVPSVLELICLKAMAKNPTDRYRSSIFMIRDLEKFLEKPQWKTYVQLKINSVGTFRNLIYASVFLFLIALFILIGSTTKEQQEILFISDSQENFEQRLLRAKKQEDIDLIYRDFIVFHVAEKRYDDAIRLYEIQSVSVKKSDKVALAMAKAHYALGNFVQASDFLATLLGKTNENKYSQEVFYYKGLVFFQQGDWTNCIGMMEKARGSQNTSESIHAQVLMYLGISYEKIGKYVEAITLLKEVTSLIPYDVRGWEYLGKSYLSTTNTKHNEHGNYTQKSYECFQKCLNMEPQNSMYYVYLAQSLTSLEKYNDAYENLEKALVLQYDNPEALNSLIYLSYQEPSLQEASFQLQKQIITTSLAIKEPDTFQEHYANIEKNYYDSFMQKTMAQKNTNSPEVFLNILCSSQVDYEMVKNVTKGLLSLRYHPKIFELIDSYRAKNTNPRLTKVFTNIKEAVTLAKEKENHFSLYYQIAKAYNQLRETPQSIYIVNNELPPEVLQKSFLDDNTNIMMKYACAKIMVRSCQWNLLENTLHLANKNRHEILHRIIAICVLRDVNFLEQFTFEDFLAIFESLKQNDSFLNSEKEFLQCMIAKSLYKLNSSYPLVQENFTDSMKILQVLFQQKSELIRLYAATSIYSLYTGSYEYKNLYEEAHDLLLKSMTHHDFVIRRHAHYYFWNKPRTLENIEAYKKNLFLALKEKNTETLEFVLFHMMKLGNLAQPYDEELQRIMKENLNSFVSLRAIFILSQIQAMHPQVIHIQNHKDTPPFVAVYAFIVTKYFYILSPAKQLDFSMIPNLLDLLNRRAEVLTYNIDFRSFIYFASAALGFYSVDLLEKETDLTAQANIISNLKQLDRSTDFMKGFVKQFRTHASNNKKLEVAKSYLKKKSPSIRKAAVSSCIYLLQENEKDLLFDKIIQNDNPMEKEGAADGYHILFRNTILADTNIFTHRQESLFKEESYVIYADLIEDRVKLLLAEKRSSIDTYKKWLSRAIELHPQHNYFYELARVYIAEKNYDKALTNLQKAIEYAPQNGLYYYQIATVMQEKGEIDKSKILDFLALAAKNSEYIGLLGKIATLYEYFEKWEEAEKLYQRIFVLNPYSSYLIEWIKLLVKKGNQQKAIKVLQKIILLDKRMELNNPEKLVVWNKNTFTSDQYLNILWENFPWIQEEYSK